MLIYWNARVVSRISDINKKKWRQEGVHFLMSCTFQSSRKQNTGVGANFNLPTPLILSLEDKTKHRRGGLTSTCPLRSFYPWKTCEKQVTMWVYLVLLLIQEAIFLWYWISFFVSYSILIPKHRKKFYCNKPNYVRLVMLVEIKPANL